MKYFHLEGIINEDLLNKFIDFWNENQSEECTIIINSGGGKSSLTFFILDVINKNHDKITLVSCGCFSAAFYLFYKARCKKILTYGTTGMYHLPYIKDVNLNIHNDPVYTSDKCDIKNMKSSDESFIKEFMKKKEIKAFNRGDDVYFTFKRLRKIFPDIKVI